MTVFSALKREAATRPSLPGSPSHKIGLIGRAAAIAAACFAQPGAMAAQAYAGIAVLSGEFGTLGHERKLDIVARLQQLCGGQGDSCSVFCSETSFGRYNLGRKPICRVVYRCPDRTTRSVEAAREEPILMRCDKGEAQRAQSSTSIDDLVPPPYIPPQPNP